jgi:hypothetical protein
LWWAGVPKADWPEDEASLQHIAGRWELPYGDRQQELVIIGMGMDEAALRAGFDACLLTDEELRAGPDAWSCYEDPFPRWEILEDEEDEAA